MGCHVPFRAASIISHAHAASAIKASSNMLAAMFASQTCGICSTSATWSNNWRSALVPRLPPGLPAPMDHAVKQAVFVKSSSAMGHMPHMTVPEIAVIGQSNVGKSSIVNMLTGSATLAKVSKKPGRTRTINHFLINSKWMLVDCPGYGDAKVSKQERSEWHELTKEYFLGRRSLAHIFLLVDASSALSSDDVHAALWLKDTGRPWSLVFTKLDIVQPGALPQANLRNMAHFVDTVERLVGVSPPYVPTSVATGLGRDALLKYIASIRQAFHMPLVFR